jgi:hypothetical protein
MDDPALKLRQAKDTMVSMQRERVRLEQQVRKLTLENTRLRRTVVALQRQTAKPPERAA